MNFIHALPIALVALVSFTAVAQANRQVVDSLTIEQLEITFLECDRRASVELLGFGDAAECSVIFEALKQRAFGGDFNRLLAWWKPRQLANAPGQEGRVLTPTKKTEPDATSRSATASPVKSR
jgi:hypothetical protein